MLEFDLRVTGDGIVILHHDPALASSNGEKLTIADTDYDTLKTHKPDLATFEEVLKSLASTIRSTSK